MTVPVAAAALMILLAPPHLRREQHSPVIQAGGETMQIKLLTPDPDVVIYWLIDSKENVPQ